MSGKYYLTNTGQQVQEAVDDVRNKTVYQEATQIQAGLMPADDKRKLDGLVKDDAISLEEIFRICI